MCIKDTHGSLKMCPLLEAGADPGAHPAPPIKLEKKRFFTRNNPKIFASPSARRDFVQCAPPNLKSWIRP